MTQFSLFFFCSRKVFERHLVVISDKSDVEDGACRTCNIVYINHNLCIPRTMKNDEGYILDGPKKHYRLSIK